VSSFQCSAQGLGFVPVLFLEVRDLGALPVVNHFLARAGLPCGVPEVGLSP
jgi:hypothetical protein